MIPHLCADRLGGIFDRRQHLGDGGGTESAGDLFHDPNRQRVIHHETRRDHRERRVAVSSDDADARQSHHAAPSVPATPDSARGHPGLRP